MRAHSSETHSSITARALRGAGFRNQTTCKFLVLSELLNLTFERELVEGGTLMSNSSMSEESGCKAREGRSSHCGSRLVGSRLSVVRALCAWKTI